MIALEQLRLGVVVPVRVRAGARRTGIAGEHDGALRIDVSAAPEKGKANRAVARTLAEALRVSPSAIELVSGVSSPQKRLLVMGIELAVVRERLGAALASDP